MIKAVLLDVDNTLLDFNLSAKEAVKTAFGILGLEFYDGIMSVFLRTNDELWHAIERKEITRRELHEIRWRRIFSELKINADGGEMERLFLADLENHAIPVSGATDLLKYLSQKYPLFTASNAPYPQQVKRLTISGLMPYIKDIMNFETEGVHKPQKEFFERCVVAMRPAKREEIALIGDSLSADMTGGKNAGFTTVWFNPHGQVAPEGLCDFTVKDLAEIKNFL